MRMPTSTICRYTYRRIQAHCAIRLSTRVGQQLRIAVGETGVIADLSPTALRTKFDGDDFTEALRLVALAAFIRQKYSRGESHVQTQQ